MKFLILAISYKYTGLCVAGIDLNTLEFVRIGHTKKNSNECAPITLNELIFNGTLLKIGDVIDIDVEKMCNNGCQTENYELININNYLNELTIEQIEKLYLKISKPMYIFHDNNYKITYNIVKNMDYSLLFCKVSNFSTYKCDGKLKSKFNYNGRNYTDISVTDCVTAGYPTNFGSGVSHENENAFLMISIPFDEWSKGNGFFKFVSGIIKIV